MRFLLSHWLDGLGILLACFCLLLYLACGLVRRFGGRF